MVITLRRSLQATAQAQIAGYSEAGHGRDRSAQRRHLGAGIGAGLQPQRHDHRHDPGRSGPGRPELGAPIFNHATLGAYPAGSSFKVFTLAAALQTGVARPATRMTCNGTWTYYGFTFRNYEEHHLAGLVDLKQAMAFSCNTTYMPLSIMVYDKDPTALTDLVREFGFGQLSGMRYLAEARGILPDAAYFEETKRWDGVIRPYNGVRPDPAGHRAGQLPGHAAAAGQRLRRDRQRRHAVDAAHRGRGAAA